MPSVSGQSSSAERSSSSTPTRGSRRSNAGEHSRLTAHTKREETSPAAPEIAKKRARNSSGNITVAAPRKSVTVFVKSDETEEFHKPKATVPSAAAVVAAAMAPTEVPPKHISGSPVMVAPSLPAGATTREKVIAVIDFLRSRRRRPDEEVVLTYTQKMYNVAPQETKACLSQLVDENKLVSIEYSNGVSYRYHMSVIARGDAITEKSNQIKAKYAAAAASTTTTTPKPAPVQAVRHSARVPTAKRPKPSATSAQSRNAAGNLLTQTEVTALKSFLRVISPRNGVVRPAHASNDTDNGDNGLVQKIRNLLPPDCLGEDSSKPGVSVYVLPPPTPISMVTIEKALKSLPHTILNPPVIDVDAPASTSSRSGRQNGHKSGTSINSMPSTSSISSSVADTPVVSDPSMAILMRRRPDDGLTELWLRSPGSTLRNAFTLQVLGELTDALQQAAEDEPIRVVAISGVGRIFSSGVDLPSLCAPVDARFVDRLSERLRAFLQALSAFPKVLVAGVNGPADGLGTSFLPLFDLIYASDTATFHTGYTILGQVPEGGASLTLASRIGTPLANDLLLAGRRLTAREAMQRGLISDVLFPKNFAQEFSLRCARIASQSSAMALETSKCLIRMQDRERIDFVIDSECRKLAEVWKTPEFRASAMNYTRHCMDDFI